VIDTKAHYRRLVARLGGIDAVEALTGRKRQTLAAYHNTNNPQQPTAEVMVELQAAAGDFQYQRAVNAALGAETEIAVLDWREAHARAYRDGEHDHKFYAAMDTSKEAAQ